MYSPQEFQVRILRCVNLDNLMKLPKSVLIDELTPNDFVFYTLSQEEFVQLFGCLPKFDRDMVTSAKLFVNIDSQYQYQESYLHLKLTSGDYVTLPLSSDKMQHLIEPFFKEAGKFYPYGRQKTGDQRDWDNKPMGFYYNESVDAHYDLLHEQLIDSIVKIASKNKLDRLNIIDGGCGTGKFLKKLTQFQGKSTIMATIKPNLFGFDVNKQNLQDCETLFSTEAGPRPQFELGNLKATDEVIRRFALDPQAKTILTLSGSLTRIVLKDGIEGLQALQSALRSGRVDIILGGGVGEPLISHHIAKQLGLKLLPLIPEEQHRLMSRDKICTNFFAYERMSLEDILAHKLKKIMKNQVLDLSLSPQPELILQALLERIARDNSHIPEKFCINLSYANISYQTVTQLQAWVRRYPNLSLKMWHHDAHSNHKIWQDEGLISKFADSDSPKLLPNDTYLLSSKNLLTPIPGVNIVRMMLDQGLELDLQQLFTQAAKTAQIELLSFLVSLSLDKTRAKPIILDWNQADNEGNTLIHLAALAGLSADTFAQVSGIDWQRMNHAHQTARTIFNIIQCPAYGLLRRVSQITFSMQLYDEDERAPLKAELAGIKTALCGFLAQGVNLVEIARFTQDIEIWEYVRDLMIAEKGIEVSQLGSFAEDYRPAADDSYPPTEACCPLAGAEGPRYLEV